MRQNVVLCGNGLKKRNTWLYMLFYRKVVESIAAEGDKETKVQYIFMRLYKGKAFENNSVYRLPLQHIVTN